MSESELLAKLNPEQREVVLCSGHCLTIACPGSGKTSTLATKAAYLLNSGSTVAAVTFTKDAAKELLERIVKLANPGNNSNLIVGTFHSIDRLMAFPNKAQSFGKSILKHQKSPFDSDWVLVNNGVREGYIARAIQTAGLQIKNRDASPIIEAARESDNYDALEDDIRTMVLTYNELLERSRQIDFQDILLKTNRALRDGSMSKLKVDFLFVDEFQDTDKTQYEWITHHARAGSSVTAVGDDDQSIYGFRRALGFEVMDKFGREFDARRILLRTNYRCRSEILGAAERLIQKNTERIDKSLVAAKGPGGVVSWESFNDIPQEAAAVAEEAFIAMEDKASFAAIARTNKELLDIQQSLVLRNVPFRKADMKSLFDYPEVQVYAALMRAIEKPTQKDIDQVLAWAGMTEEDIKGIHRLFGGSVRMGHKDDFANSRVSETGRTTWYSFAKHHTAWSTLNANGSTALINIGVREWLLEVIPKHYNKYTLETAANLFKIPPGVTLSDHLDYLRKAEMRINNDEKGKSELADPSTPIAWLMTAHGSKGLEFDRVWIVGLQHGAFPAEKSSLEEERRLMFVAMTRARDELRISATKEKKPSVFIYESDLLELSKVAA